MQTDQPGVPRDPVDVLPGENAEDALRRQNRELQRQVEELRHSLANASHGAPHAVSSPQHWRPSGVAVSAIFLAAIVLAVIAFFAGYLPLQARRAVIAGEAQQERESLPRVDVVQVGRSARKSELELPGNIEPITEAPILARADGYIARRLVDIGDRVRTGQELAQIDAPELDQQVAQANATVQQAQAALEQAQANLLQGQTDTELARITAQRTGALLLKGAVARQEDDQNQAQYKAKLANLQAIEKAIQVQRSNIAAAQANESRLDKMQSYRVVRAPFDGVITLRNVDTGALVNAGSTMLYRIAQPDTMRTYVNVPQAYADAIHPGQAAILSIPNLPGHQFPGEVARTSNALDPSSRTLLTEVRVPNTEHLLMPGMYARVDLSSARKDAPLLVPSEALIVRADGSQVAVVTQDHSIHLQKIEVGRDYGNHLEVLRGLTEGSTIIVNPGDAVQEGQKVDPVPIVQKQSK